MRVDHRRAAVLVAALALVASVAALFLVLARRPSKMCEIVTDDTHDMPAPGPMPVTVPAPRDPPAPNDAAPIVPAPLPPKDPDVALLFTVEGESYIALDAAVLELPKHGPPRLVEEAGLAVAVAAIARRDVPTELRAWRRVTVDGTCDARVTGFAVVGRLRGNARDANEDFTAWTAARVLEYGGARIAARIEGCTGTFARIATHPAIELFADADAGASSEHIDRAREDVLASDLVADAQHGWHEAGFEGAWYDDDSGGARVDVRAFTHPRTGATWLLAHAYRYNDCGQIGGNVLALYRVERGAPMRVLLRAGSAERYDQLVDLDRDGRPELTTSGTDSVAIESEDGETLTSLEPMLHGCGC